MYEYFGNFKDCFRCVEDMYNFIKELHTPIMIEKNYATTTRYELWDDEELGSWMFDESLYDYLYVVLHIMETEGKKCTISIYYTEYNDEDGCWERTQNIVTASGTCKNGVFKGTIDLYNY